MTYSFDIPAYDERVTDQADILTDTQEASLELQLQAIEVDHQAEIAVLTLDSLQWYEIAEVWTIVAHERWIGKAAVDNGLLLLIAPQERQWRIDVWYGLEWDIPDITAHNVGRDYLVPAFQQESYYTWLTQAIEQLSGLVSGTYSASDVASTEPDFWWWLVGISFLAFFLSMFTRAYLDGRKQVTDTTKQYTASWGSIINTLLGIGMVGTWWFFYLIPVALIRWWMIHAPAVKISPNNGRWRSSGWYGWGSFGWGFSGFWWGSFGGWGAWGSW